jgi:hypothetical protein
MNRQALINHSSEPEAWHAQPMYRAAQTVADTYPVNIQHVRRCCVMQRTSQDT